MKNNTKNITKILNEITPHSIRWCTPSLPFTNEKVKDIYKSDMSVSFESLGVPSEPSGVFLEAYSKAAKVYGSDRTLFSVNGTTGSNFIVLRTLAKQIPNLRILAQRNIHKSVLNACQDYGINLLFIKSNIDPHLQIFLPNSIREIVNTIKKTKPNVLLITNPTYEGYTLDLKKLVKAVRAVNSEIIIFVEEAWGSHLIFSKKLPVSAMQSGADICVQSTHKQGGSLQQTGMIHWKEKRINTTLLLESYNNLMTTSPSYILLASLDAAREQMEKNGEKFIQRSIDIAKKLADGLNTIQGFSVVELSHLKKRTLGLYAKDETKVLLDISQSGYTGFELAKLLEEENIIVEKYNDKTILFLVPFQSKTRDVAITILALKNIIMEIKETHPEKNEVPEGLFELPRNVPRVLDFGTVAKLLQEQIEKIPLTEAKNRISAENITLYPPGIPTTILGEKFTDKTINFYKNIQAFPNSHILAHDNTLETVLVVK